MVEIGDVEEVFVGTIEVDGRTYDVNVRVEFDGVEHVGHLWFTDAEWDDDEGLRDHGAIPGRTSDEVVAHTRTIAVPELAQRYRRAISDKRRFLGLRKLTEEVLSDIRHLNKVATSMRAGLLAIDDAATEIDQTEQRLHSMIDQLRLFAGVAAA